MTGTTPRRRQRLSAEQRREQIMAAAVLVLAEQGYQGASAEAIAQRADVSKGLLWHYFASRDDLMEQTAERTLIALRGAVGAQIDLTAPAPEVIRSAMRAAAAVRRTHTAERHAIQEIINNLRTVDGRSRLTLRNYEDTYAAQERIFRRGQDEGDFRSSLDPRVLAVTYQGSVDAMLGYLDAYPDADPDDHATALADVLLGGICAHPPTDGRPS
jgi:AcrR family transcriptional regulator